MSVKMKTSDPAYWMLSRKTPHISEEPDFILGGVEKALVYSQACYICNDPEFAQMGLPLCYACVKCKGHVAADDSRCSNCGFDNFCENGPPDDEEDVQNDF